MSGFQGHRATDECTGCGIPISDGYVEGCIRCAERRRARLKRGALTSPTGYPGEAIDNTDPRGRIVLA